MLVYEYMENKSLDSILFSKSSSPRLVLKGCILVCTPSLTCSWQRRIKAQCWSGKRGSRSYVGLREASSISTKIQDSESSTGISRRATFSSTKTWTPRYRILAWQESLAEIKPKPTPKKLWEHSKLPLNSHQQLLCSSQSLMNVNLQRLHVPGIRNGWPILRKIGCLQLRSSGSGDSERDEEQRVLSNKQPAQSACLCK